MLHADALAMKANPTEDPGRAASRGARTPQSRAWPEGSLPSTWGLSKAQDEPGRDREGETPRLWRSLLGGSAVPPYPTKLLGKEEIRASPRLHKYRFWLREQDLF